MPTNVYIDGFNLYYGSLKSRWPGLNLKWLDIGHFCSSLLPGHTINKIRYFTAGVIPPPYDPQQRIRQDTYIRALNTIRNLDVHLSWFNERPGLRSQFPFAYQYNNRKRPPQRVLLSLPEEKGSDVNLASYLLFDCFQNQFDEAVVISNDSDLVVPIKLVVGEFHKTVSVINPHPKVKRSAVLAGAATWTFQDINKRYFVNSQFPASMTDAQGTFIKPSSW